MSKCITESVGYYSPYDTLEEALAQFNSRGRQVVAISEPSEVLVRQRSLDDGRAYLYQACQVYVNMRFSPNGQWRKCQLLTFGKERYGTVEQ